MHYSSPYLILPFFSSLTTGILAFYVFFKRRREPLAFLVSLLMFLLAVWACAYGLQTAATEVRLKLFLYQVGSVCAISGGVVALVISMEASGFGHWITRRRVIIVSSVSALMVLSALTAQYHSLNRYDLHLAQSGPLMVMGYKSGPLYIIQIAFVSLLYLAAQVFFFIGAVRARGADRFRCLFLLIGTVVPFFVERLGVTPFKGFSMTTSVLWFSGACYTLAILRHGLLEILPVARSALFDQLGDPALVFDFKGALIDYNRAARELLCPGTVARPSNMQASALIRFPVLETLSDGMRAGIDEHIKDAVDGERFWEIRSLPLLRGKQMFGYLVQLHDTSVLKRSEEELRRAKSLWELTFDSVPDMIAIIDNNHRFVRVNKAMAERLGSSAEQYTGLYCFECMHGSSGPHSSCPHSRTIADGRQHIADLHEDRLGGDLLVSTSPLFDEEGRMIASVHVAKDITERKRAEEEIRKLNEDLKINVLQLESASHAKSRFLSTVSHELRTPLQAIIGFSELALEQPDPRRTAEYLAMINDSSLSLLDMVNDILDLSRIEAGRIEVARARFNLRKQLDNLATIYTHQAESKGVAFSLAFGDNVPDWVVGDPLRVRQILTNIIGNAVKFTEKGEVAVAVSLCPPGGDNEEGVRVCFTVRDTGIGIPEDKKEKVFDSFTQADPDITRRFGGSGLGASIARQLARLMGGTITFESREGKGSIFVVIVPFAKAVSEEPDATVPERETASRPLSILLAEDNLFNQRLMVDALTLRGHNVALAGNGLEALERWRASRFDLVIMDMMMPVMDGCEAARRIRAEEDATGRVRTPVVAVSANADVSVREKCLEAGMDNCVAKPVTPSRLNGILGRFTAAPAVSSVEDRPPSDNEGLFDSDLIGAVVNNPERVVHYAGLLLADLDREMGRLAEALEDGDRQAISRASHAIKGATRPIKGMEMSMLAEAIQLGAETESNEFLNDQMVQLQEIYEKVRRELKRVSKS